MAVKISEFLSPDAVISELAASDKAGVLQELGARLAECTPGVPVDKLVSVLRDREQLGSTGIGDGIAIPHGKLNGLDGLVATFAVSRPGVDFEAIDGGPTHLFFALVAPENSAGIHLKALARISRLFKSPEFRDRILQTKEAGDIWRLISEEDAKA